jgi:hypothetical protein
VVNVINFKSGDIVTVYLREGHDFLHYGGDAYGLGRKAVVKEVRSSEHIRVILETPHDTFIFNVHPGELSLHLTTNKEAKEYLTR